MSQAEARANAQEPTTTSPIAGEATLTLADIEAGLSALPRARFARGVSWIGGAAVIGMVAYRWFEGRDRTSLVIIGVVLLGLLFSSRNPARRIAQRVYAGLDESSKKLLLSVDEQGFHVTSSGNEALLPWSEVRRCVETRNVLVVFVSQHDAQILPKRAFSAADLESIRGWTKTKIVQHNEPWLTPELRKRITIWLFTLALVWTAWMYLGGR